MDRESKMEESKVEWGMNRRIERRRALVNLC
jgi:hypothetical protein